MAEPSTNEKGTREAASPHELEEVVRMLGLIFTNTYLYGAKHVVTLKAMDDCFGFLTQVLQTCGDLSFSVSEAGLTVNETTIEQKNPLLKSFATRMSSLDISSFGLGEGLTRKVFDDLIELMNAKPDEIKGAGGFAQIVISAQLENVRTRTVVYKAITEDEVIVSKKILEDAAQKADVSIDEMVAFLGGESSSGGKGGGSGSGKGEGPGSGPGGATGTVTGTGPGAGTGAGAGVGEGIVLGESDADRRERRDAAIQKLADDPAKLGDVIMQAVERDREQEGLPGAQRTEQILVGCLRRAYEALSKSPGVKTQKGKKNLERTLMLLEKDILARLKSKEKAGEDVSATAKSVSEAIEEMHDELEIDGLAAEYMRKRNAIESNEQRILRFIKAKGLDKVSETELRDRLEEGGLTPLQWQELLAKSGITWADIQGKQKAIPIGEGHLAELLSNMLGILAERDKGGEAPPPGQTAEQITTMVAAVDQEVRDLVAKTEQKITELVEEVKAVDEGEATAEAGGGGASENEKALMPRKKLMVVLAELVQEICQPLAVINCSIDMIRSKHLGEVTEAQLEMLNLASTSGERVRVLAEKLLEMSGLPTTLSPDAGIQSSLYK